MLAITVDTLQDIVDANDGFTSLREAVSQANLSFDNDIDFSVTGTIILSLGELRVFDNLTITGPGPGLLTIDANQSSRIIYLNDSNASLTLEGLRLTGGRVSDNGGAIWFNSDGTLHLINSEIVDNETTNFGKHGGGIFARTGNVSLINSSVSGNTSSGKGGGIAMPFGWNITLRNSDVNGNITDGFRADGGGIYTQYGRVILENSDVSGNQILGTGNGGAIKTGSGYVTLTDSTINGNYITEEFGAGGSGGGIYTSSGRITITGSTVSRNSANSAGGIYVRFGSVISLNSTISENRTTRDASSGGGIFSVFGDITLMESTLTGNTALGSGGGIFFSDMDDNVNGSLTVRNSILAGNIDNGLAPDLVLDPDITPIVEYSLIGTTDHTFGGNGNIIGTPTNPISPLVGPLALNGGISPTHALLPGSPALNMGNPGVTSDPTEFDQRGDGFSRVVGNTIDIGAYEAQSTPSADFDSDIDVDGHDFLIWQRGFGKTNAQRTDGNSDDDTDVDASDLAAWLVSYAQVTAPVAESQASGDREELIDVAMAFSLVSEMHHEELLIAPSANIQAAFAFANRADDLLRPNRTSTESIKLNDDPEETNNPEAVWLSEEMLERVFG